MKHSIYIVCVMLLIGTLLGSCFKDPEINNPDSTPPSPPTDITYKALLGGARIFYTIPNDEDLLSVNASYTNAGGKKFSFSASYFRDSLDVIGFGDTAPKKVEIFSLDRANNKSEVVTLEVVPLESAISRVANSIELKPAFSSFFIDWENELEQSINVYVKFNYNDGGTNREFTSVFSSNLPVERRFIDNLNLPENEQVNVKIQVADIYGNFSDFKDFGSISLLSDDELPKSGWYLPQANDSIGGVPQGFGDGLEGRLRYLVDGIIDRGDNLNFMHTHSRGRTGNSADGNMPWNVIIDLGAEYKLSRILTHQRHSGGVENISRGQYYQSENVGIYEMYIWDEDAQAWELITEHKIPVPVGKSELEFVKLGEAGDLAYMFPDEPQFTKPTRYFRYRAMKSFNANYTREDANCLSEITLYGKKVN
ncbi:DUF4959 domain-containing protein [Portibacter lacus]|uniref:DUF4959 domain-containing protein n=1 Tax=Portibacter lacus TaxID=1099794 RepID=A0AA37WF26_9BACT|nr:DUF4959 domain-containing protein [Portibacter lacus]GLR18207.1 hypothetical protein GCM10007940_28220 [Portibacter lacus]